MKPKGTGGDGRGGGTVQAGVGGFPAVHPKVAGRGVGTKITVARGAGGSERGGGAEAPRFWDPPAG